MKKLFLLLGLVVAATFSSCSSVPRSSIRYSPPSVAPVRSTISKSQEHVATAQVKAASATAKIAQLQKAVEKMPDLMELAAAAHQDLDDLTAELLATKAELVKAQEEVTVLEKKVGDQTEILNRTIDEKNAAITARDAATHAYHKLKLWCCLLGAALAGFLMWRFKSLLLFLGPYSLIAVFAVPIIVFAFLWGIL